MGRKPGVRTHPDCSIFIAKMTVWVNAKFGRQTALAKAIGITQHQLSRYISGEHRPSPERVVALEAAIVELTKDPKYKGPS